MSVSCSLEKHRLEYGPFVADSIPVIHLVLGPRLGAHPVGLAAAAAAPLRCAGFANLLPKFRRCQQTLGVDRTGFGS